jgi:dephospho-CoA kinase
VSASGRCHHPPRLAVTGGIGSGKSTALAFLRELGGATLSSDDVVHQVYTDAEVQGALARRFGDAVVRDGRVDRDVLGRVAFGDLVALSWLEEFTHPRVRKVVEEWAARQESQAEPPALLVVEVPLLFESGAMLDVFDFVLAVTAPEGLRRRRLAAKLTPEQFARRVEHQLSEADKAERSDFVYENDGSRQHMKQFIAETYAAIIAAAAAEAEEAPIR